MAHIYNTTINAEYQGYKCEKIEKDEKGRNILGFRSARKPQEVTCRSCGGRVSGNGIRKTRLTDVPFLPGIPTIYEMHQHRNRCRTCGKNANRRKSIQGAGFSADTTMRGMGLPAVEVSGFNVGYKNGNRTVTEFDAVVLCLNRMLGMEDSDQVPRIRTIRGAVHELKNVHPDIGIGEDQIRTAVGCGWVDVIRVGSRAYLCMQQFEEPYVRRFIDHALTAVERKQTTSDHAAAQVGALLKKSSGVPMVKRVRHER